MKKEKKKEKTNNKRAIEANWNDKQKDSTERQDRNTGQKHKTETQDRKQKHKIRQKVREKIKNKNKIGRLQIDAN